MAGANRVLCGTKRLPAKIEIEQTERPNMKISKYFALLAVTMLPLLPAAAQTALTPISSSGAAYKLPPGAAEVEKLTESGVGDDVVLSYIGQAQIYYNLSAADIVALKSAGVSSPAVTAMLNHDSALHNQQMAVSSTPVTTTQSASAPMAAAPNPASTTAVVVAPTPAPQVEVIPISPGPDYMWTSGWWSWNSGAWIWSGGYWGYPTRPGNVWYHGNYYHGRGYGSVRGCRH